MALFFTKIQNVAGEFDPSFAYFKSIQGDLPFNLGLAKPKRQANASSKCHAGYSQTDPKVFIFRRKFGGVSRLLHGCCSVKRKWAPRDVVKRAEQRLKGISQEKLVLWPWGGTANSTGRGEQTEERNSAS